MPRGPNAISVVFISLLFFSSRGSFDLKRSDEPVDAERGRREGKDSKKVLSTSFTPSSAWSVTEIINASRQATRSGSSSRYTFLTQPSCSSKTQTAREPMAALTQRPRWTPSDVVARRQFQFPPLWLLVLMTGLALRLRPCISVRID